MSFNLGHMLASLFGQQEEPVPPFHQMEHDYAHQRVVNQHQHQLALDQQLTLFGPINEMLKQMYGPEFAFNLDMLKSQAYPSAAGLSPIGSGQAADYDPVGNYGTGNSGPNGGARDAGTLGANDLGAGPASEAARARLATNPNPLRSVQSSIGGSENAGRLTPEQERILRTGR